jgi:hypothetical protein
LETNGYSITACGDCNHADHVDEASVGAPKHVCYSVWYSVSYSVCCSVFYSVLQCALQCVLQALQ